MSNAIIFEVYGSPTTLAQRLRPLTALGERFATSFPWRGEESTWFSDHPRVYATKPDSIQRAIIRLAAGHLSDFSLTRGECPRPFTTSRYVALNGYGLKGDAPATELAVLELREVWGDTPPITIDTFRSWCLDLAEASGLPLGYANPYAPELAERAPSVDPSFGLHTPSLGEAGTGGFVEFGASDVAQFVPRPAWALWLTSGHIEALGGANRIRREAPVAVVIERASGLWLQLTEDPFDIIDGKLRDLAEFLAPVIPSIDQLRGSALRSGAGWVAAPSFGEADHYLDYTGPAFEFEEGVIEWMDRDRVIHVVLREEPADAARVALERLVDAWCAWTVSELGADAECMIEGAIGWNPRRLSVMVSMGSDVGVVLREFGRRLAGWAARWQISIERWVVGEVEE